MSPLRLINLTIKQRLILMALISILSLLTLLMLGSYATHKVKALETDAIKATYLETEMLMLRRNEKDFLARKDLKYQDKFNANLGVLLANTEALKQDLDGHDIDSSTLTSLIPLFQQYGDKFNQLVGVQQQIGLHSKDGYYGTLRAAVHEAESQIKTLNDYQLLAGMLQLRRNEKDFMLRRDTKYVTKLSGNLDKLLATVKGSPHSPEQKANLTKALSQYKTDFMKLVELDKKLGLNHKSGLLGELRSTIHQTEELLKQAELSISDAINDNEKNSDLLFMAISALLIAINVALVAWIAISIIRPVEKLSNAMTQASRERDLTLHVDIKGEDEITSMANVYNTMMDEFRKLISQVMSSANQLSSSAEQLTNITGKASDGVMRQRAESDQVATAINEMSSTVQEVARNANEAAQASCTADEQASKGNQVVGSAISGINQLAAQVTSTSEVIKDLERESGNISTVLNVIRDIAEQTNLLALNAAIEAARAGEQGRGFAVVADEVRTLAQRSHESTQEINDIIKCLQEKAASAVGAMENGLQQTESTVELAQQAGESLDEITSAIASITDMNVQIASAAEEQSAVAEEINRNVVNITQIADETAGGARETTDTSQALARMAVELRDMINKFKVH